MIAFINESMITDKLARAVFTKIVLFAGSLLTVFFIFVLW
jgi:hypothetical protein